MDISFSFEKGIQTHVIYWLFIVEHETVWSFECNT